jgi:hypothetical protein
MGQTGMNYRHRESGVWGVLFAIGVCLAGCNSDSGAPDGDYRSFSSIPETEVTSPETDEQPGETAPATGEKKTAEVKRAAGETAPSEIVQTPDQSAESTPDANDPPPLVAVKPVLADSSAAIKDNIDNTTASSAEREIKLLVADKSFKEEGPENSLRVSYDDFDLLKILNMDPVPLDAVEYFPSWLSSLDGKRVRVRGFMYPPFKEEGLRQFILARDNQICCFGKNPKIYDLVYVAMRDGVTASYIQNRPFDVVGTFRIRPDAEDGEWFSLYELEDAIVIDR